MSTIKNVSGQDLMLPWLNERLVLAGEVVEVPEEHVYAYTCQTETWAPVDDDAKALHESGVEAFETTRRAEEPLAEPAGNATTEAWAAWVVAAGLATAEEVDGMGRNELREAYGTPAPGQDPADAAVGTPSPADGSPADGDNTTSGVVDAEEV